MGNIENFLLKAKQQGLGGAFKLAVKKVSGLKKCEDEIDTLYYFLN